ncbi:MAG TPA: hypothetical protein VN773_01115, partial [Verrucomicrobiae bacterium]|nr:hypothetical protein [Verrucomicrobiae bacterium]
MARWIAPALVALAIASSACGLMPEPGLVPLATSRAGLFDTSCPAALLEGTLIADPITGSAIAGQPKPIPIIWPFGFRG